MSRTRRPCSAPGHVAYQALQGRATTRMTTLPINATSAYSAAMRRSRVCERAVLDHARQDIKRQPQARAADQRRHVPVAKRPGQLAEQQADASGVEQAPTAVERRVAQQSTTCPAAPTSADGGAISRPRSLVP